ncbi:MAG: bifunctional phosphoribosylaminoimidazolecarboxamide formyltransferase/IMP cyclohydrolase, partial [Frankiaceae bacterium]
MSEATQDAAEGLRPIRRALISVSDKSGLDELAVALREAEVQVVSTGATAARLAGLGLDVVLVSEVTGFPEALNGRVKTLHPHIHAGLLADLTNPAHAEQLRLLGIAPFDLVVVNLYPFRETVAAGAGRAETIEQIDIGGPAMIRAAAKNADCVAVVVSPARYGAVRAALARGGFGLVERRVLAAEAFTVTADYDIAVASWMGNVPAPDPAGWPSWIAESFRRVSVLRYGENPHQRAALYGVAGAAGLAQARQLHGKEMSYNNYVDTDAARR